MVYVDLFVRMSWVRVSHTTWSAQRYFYHHHHHIPEGLDVFPVP